MSGERRRFTILIEDRDLRLVERYAAARGISTGEAFRRLVRRWVRRQRDKQIRAAEVHLTPRHEVPCRTNGED